MPYDELIKRLRETSIDFGESDHVSVMMIEAADAIERLNAFNLMWQEATKMAHEAEPKWIPVTERLPMGADKSGKVCENVILLLSVPFSENFVTSGWINGITKKVYYLDEFEDFICKTDMSAVKAWMPLPQPPESDGES